MDSRKTATNDCLQGNELPMARFTWKRAINDWFQGRQLPMNGFKEESYQ